MVDITTLVTNYNQYVFGSVAWTGLAFLFVVFLIGVRRGWPLDTFVIVLMPLLSVMGGSFLPFNLNPLMLIGVGLVIGFAMVAIWRR